MSTHVTPILATSAIVAAVLVLLVVSLPTEASGTNPKRMLVSEAAPISDEPAPDQTEVPEAGTSLYPELTIDGGSSEQRTRLALAVSRFRDAGLELPALRIAFSSDDEACRGNYGLYEHDPLVPRITLCSESEFVYEHELAHAWEAHVATDERRQAFMNVRGYEVWSSGDVPWNDRGIEGAAFIIQQTIGGLALPSLLNEEFKNRSAAFEALTGTRDPRLPQLVPVTLAAGELS